MRKTVLEFARRGLSACGFGPMVLAVMYLILHHSKVIDTLTVSQVSMGIFLVSLVRRLQALWPLWWAV